jgi:(2Fe-2S) ferredoxin
MKYKKHIFICINQRPAGERQSCGEAHGMELVEAFKSRIKRDKLNMDVRAQKTGCLDICELGPSIVVYPEGVFYGKVDIADVEEIYQSHIINDMPVERLRLTFKTY